jgi:hypothetical protein
VPRTQQELREIHVGIFLTWTLLRYRTRMQSTISTDLPYGLASIEVLCLTTQHINVHLLLRIILIHGDPSVQADKYC